MQTIVVDDHFKLITLREHREDRGSIDIETTITENPWTDPPELVSVAVTYDGDRVFIIPDAEMLGRCAHILRQSEWIMHNGLFDKLMLKLVWNLDLTLVHDTMAMQYILDPDKPKGLQVLSEEYLGLEPYKDVDYKNILDEPREKVYAMNAEDVRRTHQLFRILADQLNDDAQLSRVYQWILMPAVNNLIKVTLNGIPVDREKLAVITQTSEAVVEEMDREIQRSVGEPDPDFYPKGWPKPSWWRVRQHGKYEGDIFNQASSKQVGHVLYDLWNLPVLLWNTDEAGNETSPSTNADTLLELEILCREKGWDDKAQWIANLLTYRKHTKLLSYYQSWPKYMDDKNWLHPRYKPLHTVTGRLSSESPNIQQVPRQTEVRAVFGNHDGYSWIKADYSQVELRLAAIASQEMTMLEAYHSGGDLHSLTAKLVLGDETPEARQVGKTLNFGLLYGAGPSTLQRVARSDYGVSLTLEEAKAYHEGFFRAYPALKQWHQDMERSIVSTGVARSPLGRIRYLPKAKIPHSVADMRSQKYAAIREGINHVIQSFASDLLLNSLNTISQMLEGTGAFVVAEVHDELDLLCPNDIVHEVCDLVKVTMEDMTWLKEKFGITLPIRVLADVQQGSNWGYLQ